MTDRAQAWRAALDAARRRLVDLEFLDGTDAVAALREQVIRTRLAASAERQAHESRAVVLDIEQSAQLGGLRFIVAVPTGDRGELREAMADAIAAMQMAGDDVDGMRSAMASHRELRALAQATVDALYCGDDYPADVTPPDFTPEELARRASIIRAHVANLSGWLADHPEAP